MKKIITNDTAGVADYKGKNFASQVLLSIIPDEDTSMKTEWFGRTSKLGDFRRVDIALSFEN